MSMSQYIISTHSALLIAKYIIMMIIHDLALAETIIDRVSKYYDKYDLIITNAIKNGLKQ